MIVLRIIPAIVLLFVLGCNQSYAQQEKLNKRINFSEELKDKSLFIDLDHGSVNIIGSDNPFVELSIYSSEKLNLMEKNVEKSTGIAKDNSKSIKLNIIEKGQ